MTGVWHVWTDGSCQHGWRGETPRRTPGAGGWCAIVEHGSEGEVHRGRVASTTNVRMEIVAATMGLRATPLGADVVLHTDCTTILCVRDALERETLDPGRGPDRVFWRDLGVELAARNVAVDLLGKGVRDDVHRRAHGYAGAEARAQLALLPANVVPLDREHRKAAKARRRALAAKAAVREEDVLGARRRAYKAEARRTWREGLR